MLTVLVRLILRLKQVETVKITAYYPESADIEAITKQVNERLAELTDFGLENWRYSLGYSRIGWRRLGWELKKYYEPARITHDLTIVPSWTDYEASVGEKIIKLDPGMAFGTGTHQRLRWVFLHSNRCFVVARRWLMWELVRESSRLLALCLVPRKSTLMTLTM